MQEPTVFKYDWVWRKPKGTGHLNAKKQPTRDKEDILVFYRKQPKYNPQFTTGTPYKNKAGKDHSATTSMTGSYGTYTNYREDNDGRRYPRQGLDKVRVSLYTLASDINTMEELKNVTGQDKAHSCGY